MSVREFIDKVKDISGYMMAAYTDKYVVDFWPLKNGTPDDIANNEEKLLELRIFNENDEYKLYRSDISRKFLERSLNDTCGLDHYDEKQYLDIDESIIGNESNGGINVSATGGGKYYYPGMKTLNAKLVVRYYVGKYDQTGQARIEDWRLIGFEEE